MDEKPIFLLLIVSHGLLRASDPYKGGLIDAYGAMDDEI